MQMAPQNYIEVAESEAETCYSDDSQENPSFDILEETQSRFSNLSVEKKPRSRVPVDVDEHVDCTEIGESEFDAKDQKSFEIVQKIIEGGQVDKLKVEQCKLYLRKHGLRLMGKKDVLIHRIKEHISIMNGEGEHKYPASSFVMNCKGDACTGDVVMFEQKVYEMFSIVSRSATGPPCGTRVVAGRIVKESYGAAKQQHTFTIEVLWSKGEKPLPPLHPLLIKGRNLYRLKTMRQRWEDENQRRMILSEKHDRGITARAKREARLQEKEMKKALREIRASKGNIQNEKQDPKRKTSTCPMLNLRNPTKQDLQNISLQHEAINLSYADASCKENLNSNIVGGPVRGEPNGPFRNNLRGEQNMSLYPSRPFQNPSQSYGFQQGYKNGQLPGGYYQGERQQHSSYGFQQGYQNVNLPRGYYQQNPSQSYGLQQGQLPMNYYQGRRQRLCRYGANCPYGTKCTYLH